MKTKFVKSAVAILSLSFATLLFCLPASSQSANWQSGSRMGKKMVVKNLTFAVHIAKNPGIDIGVDIELIDCCKSSNQNTACNTAGQNSQC